MSLIYEVVWKLNEITWTTVSSIGTFIAILISLYLATRDRKEKINIVPDYISGNYNAKYGDLIYTKLQNTGNCDVHIDELYVTQTNRIRRIYNEYNCNLKKLFTLRGITKILVNEGLIRFTPLEFTQEKHFKDTTILPCTLQRFHSFTIIIPRDYFEELVDFPEQKVLITVVTSTGKKFSKKMKVYY